MTEKKLSEIVYLDSGTLVLLLKKLENQGIVNKVFLNSTKEDITFPLQERGKH